MKSQTQRLQLGFVGIILVASFQLQAAQSASMASSSSAHSQSSTTLRQASQALDNAAIQKLSSRALIQALFTTIDVGDLQTLKLVVAEANHRQINIYTLVDDEGHNPLYRAVRREHENTIIPISGFLWTSFTQELKPLDRYDDEGNNQAADILNELRINAHIENSTVSRFSRLQTIQFNYVTSRHGLAAFSLPVGLFLLYLDGWACAKMLSPEDATGQALRDEEIGLLGIAAVTVGGGCLISQGMDDLNILNYKNQSSMVKKGTLAAVMALAFSLGYRSGSHSI